MTSSRQSRTNYGRRFRWMLVAIALGAGLYSAGWFYAAQRVTDEVKATIATLNGNGRRASCEEVETRGYPFRLGIFCRSVLFEDAARGVSFRAGPLRSAAQIYQPWRVIGELDGPARLEAPGLNALTLDWSALRGSARLASQLPERVSLEVSDLAIQLDEQGASARPLAQFDSAELHLRPAGNNFDIAVRFSELVLDSSLVSSMPPLSGLVDFSLTDGALPGRLNGDLRGQSGVIRTLTVSALDGAGLTLSGPVAIDDTGLIDAQLSITMREPMALARILGDLVPDRRREIELALSALAGTSGTTDASGSSLPLRIAQGRVSLGFIPLGTIPPF